MRLFPEDQSKQTTRLKRTLLGFSFYALCAMFIGFSTWQDLFPFHAFVIYTMGFVTVSTSFFIIIRLGWNLRFRDPNMTEAQILCSAMLCTYVVSNAGTFRGIFMLAYVVGLMFAGTHLRTRQLARLAALPLVVFPIVVLIVARQSAVEIDWRIEVVNWLALCVILAFTVVLVGRLSLLQSRLKASKAELQAALAKLTDMAAHDDLTGLYNRRCMVELLEREKSRADRRGDGGFCVCLVDIDHFKQINDTYGHGNGDSVLRTFAHVAEQSVRSVDFLGRWGGEEFLMLLPDTSADLAAACAQRIKAELEKTAFDGLPPDFRITMSAGIAEYRAGGEIQDLLERADQALYRAKRAGRNRIMMAGQVEERVG